MPTKSRSPHRRSTPPAHSAPVGGRTGRIGGYFVSGSFASNVVRPIGVTSGIGSTWRWTMSCRLSVLLALEDPFVPVRGVSAIAIPPQSRLLRLASFRAGGRPIWIGRSHRNEWVSVQALFERRDHLQYRADDPC